jgi:hypothetical protein
MARKVMQTRVERFAKIVASLADSNKNLPGVREIASATFISRESVYRYIKRLKARNQWPYKTQEVLDREMLLANRKAKLNQLEEAIVTIEKQSRRIEEDAKRIEAARRLKAERSGGLITEGDLI